MLEELNPETKLETIFETKLEPIFETKLEPISEKNLEPISEAKLEPISEENLEKLKKEIEQKVNFSSPAEGLITVFTNPELLINKMESAFTEFKEKTGRNMTYLEMRYMMG